MKSQIGFPKYCLMQRTGSKVLNIPHVSVNDQLLLWPFLLKLRYWKPHRQIAPQQWNPDGLFLAPQSTQIINASNCLPLDASPGDLSSVNTISGQLVNSMGWEASAAICQFLEANWFSSLLWCAWDIHTAISCLRYMCHYLLLNLLLCSPP
jgi:hypothetical protein